MRRAPIVLGSTVAGVAAVLGFHTRPQAPPVATAARTTASASTPASSSSSSGGTRTATGALESDRYGNVQVRVTMSGGRITAITPVQLGSSDPRSAQIDAFAAPQLRSEALTAQSAKIDVVSGATYTSESYIGSLQSALDRLNA